MEDVEGEGLGFECESAGLSQVVAANPALAERSIRGSKGFAVASDAQAAVDNVVGSEDDDAQVEGLVELLAHFFLQAFADGISRAVGSSDVGCEEGAIGVGGLAGSDVDDAPGVSLSGGFEHIIEAFEVDEKGF